MYGGSKREVEMASPLKIQTPQHLCQRVTAKGRFVVPR
jgi:hypothetical protein